MKRTILSMLHRYQCARLFAASIRHDSAVRIISEARAELDRAVAIAKQTRGELENVQADERTAGYALIRFDRHRALGL